MHDISHAQSRTKALAAAKALADVLAEHPKAVGKVTGELDVLLELLRLPRGALEAPAHDQPESIFSTVRLRTRVIKGAGNRQAAVAMAFKLLEAAQDRWRRIRSPELVPLVRAGATFIDRQLQERSDNPTDQPGQNNVEVFAA